MMKPRGGDGERAVGRDRSNWQLKLHQGLFADPHLFEIARMVPAIKAAAVGKIIVDDDEYRIPQGDPRRHVSSCGVAFIYTVAQEASGFAHHVSARIAGGETPHVVGRRFALLFVQLIGLPIEDAYFEVAPSSAHHAEVILNTAEHEALARTPVAQISARNVDEVRKTLDGLIARVTWSFMAPPIE